MPCLKQCAMCPDLVKSRKRIVNGDGSGKSGIMFVGICPGNHLLRGGADSTGITFKGDVSGWLFERLLGDLGFKRESVYTTNLVKCRPAKKDIRYNRLPAKTEIANCFPYLLYEISVRNPKLIICFGSIVFAEVMKRYSSEAFAKSHIVKCWHPAYIARDSTKYREWLEDVRGKIEWALNQ